MARDIIKAAERLVEKCSKVIVASVDKGGFPNQKAMYNARVRDGIKAFFFTTNTSSLRVRQFRDNPKASIYFYEGRFFRGLMLKGTMEILQDEESRKLIWREGDTLYYKEGVNDPDYSVLYFRAEKGRYYENFKSIDFDVI